MIVYAHDNLRIEVRLFNLLTKRESAIFERIPILYIWPRYSSVAATTTKISTQSSSDIYPVFKRPQLLTLPGLGEKNQAK